MNTALLNDIADYVLLSATPAIVLFAVFYSRSPWRSTPAGRALMYQSLALTMVVIVVLLSLFLGNDYFGRGYVRIIAYLVLSAVFWRQFYVLRRYQKEGDIPMDFNPFRRRKSDDETKVYKHTK